MSELAETIKLFGDAERLIVELRETLRQINRRRGGEALNQEMIYGLDFQSLKELDSAEAFIKSCKQAAMKLA